AEEFFNFSYRLECYTPAPKRKYGYFVLPLLHKGALVGRMDAKMHRQQGSLEVIALYGEEGVSFTAGIIAGLRQAIGDFAAWQGATRVVFRQLPGPLAHAWGEGWE
ncbi:winged helix DNA-binding domain-containing protein, partial [Leptospira borgpetersenii serovar Arborea]|nr:winged helix DNA-binding domain-containing protein [Leptospira borgpetersenii serovar Arborea]